MQAKQAMQAMQSRTTSRLAHMKDILPDKLVRNRLEHTLTVPETIKRTTVNQHIEKESTRDCRVGQPPPSRCTSKTSPHRKKKRPHFQKQRSD